MRIATWNLERPRRGQASRLSAIHHQINEINADIWVLTETHECISPGDGYQIFYSAPVPTLYRYKEGEHWVAIASRMPIRQLSETVTPDISLLVEIDTPIGVCIVYGTVLPYHAERGWHGAQRNWEAHYKAIEYQGVEWKRLKENYPHALRCLIGDLNQTRDGKHRDGYGTAKGRQLLTTALETSELVCVTEEDMIASGKLQEKRNIDHICLNQPWSSHVSEVGVWNKTKEEILKISDHNGIYVDLSVED